MTAIRVEAWRVHDTGLVAVPTRYRRLGGLVRHLQGQGPRWPDRVVLEITGDHLRVSGPEGDLGAWPVDQVTAVRQSSGPPVHFVLEVPGASHLLAAPAEAATEVLLSSLG